MAPSVFELAKVCLEQFDEIKPSIGENQSFLRPLLERSKDPPLVMFQHPTLCALIKLETSLRNWISDAQAVAAHSEKGRELIFGASTSSTMVELLEYIAESWKRGEFHAVLSP
jgi:hypothetical protein